MKSHNKKDWLKLTAVAVVAIVLAGLGTIIASNVAPASSPVGPVASEATTSTMTTTVTATTVPQPLAVAADSSSTTVPTEPAEIEVSDTVVEFGDTGTTVNLELTNIGGTTSTWTIESSEPAISTSPTEGEIESGEVVEVSALLDRTVVAEGELGAILTVFWGDQEVQVFVQGVHADNPVIIAPKASPSTVVAQTGADCSPGKTTITVRVKDTSEIAEVIVRWSNGASVVETTMTLSDVENYKAVIGPFVEVVSPNVKVVAKDVHDNAGGAAVPLSVVACP